MSTASKERRKKDPMVVDAEPTKELFIHMLTRDLNLHDAINDLVDNSVDAVRELVMTELPDRPEKTLKSQRYESFALNIDFNEHHFTIADNCGGMPAEIAREYAFRFGRDKDAPLTPGSIGQFGIGMKRALFKLGRHFHITSTAKDSDFILDVPVTTWANDEDTWDFRFTELNEPASHTISERKLEIKVTQLNTDVAQLFTGDMRKSFESILREDVSRSHIFTISNGFTININGKPIPPADLTLLYHEDFKVGTYDKTFRETTDEGEPADVRVRIFVGLGPKSLKDGGWYVFCNDRLVAGAEQSSVTGWTGISGDGIPIYHDQYARFRGYVFFDSDKSGALPWNTTKTSMDRDSKLYQAIRREMINMSRPVITFLNALKRENESGNTSRQKPLHEALNAAKQVSVLAVPMTQQSKNFVAPKPAVRKPATTQTIKFSVPTDEFLEVQQKLGVSKEEVGPALFDFYYRSEIG